MIKILHSADWHMDAPLGGFSHSQRKFLRQQMLRLPDQIADIAIREGCQLCLLAGDLFDGAYTTESVDAMRRAFARMDMPIFIAPGNHDPMGANSPWVLETWPANVHIFPRPQISSLSVPELDCRVYGAGYDAKECPALLDGFQAQGQERYALLVLHADPTSTNSVYCPITAAQIREAGLDYAALGHIHAAGRFGAGAGMCAWPGCPMGHGYDETGIKGVLIAELEESAHVRFIPSDVPRFYDESVTAGDDPVGAVERVLPPEGSRDFFRIRLTGEADPAAMERLAGRFDRYPNLRLLDETIPTGDLWESAGQDTLEGVYFRILRTAAEEADAETAEALELAARISRQILQGREVELP